MTIQKNTVTDYLAQKKNGVRTPVSTPGTGARFSSQRAVNNGKRPAEVSRNTAAFTSESGRRSPSPFPASDDDSRVLETQSSRDYLSRMDLAELLRSPARRSMTKLVPPSNPAHDKDDKWFHLTHGIARQIREIFQGDYQGPYHNISNTPQDVQDRWFKAFAQCYNWDLEYTKIVEKKFKAQLGKQLCSLVCDWKIRANKPFWMGDTVWEGLLNHWATEEHQEASERTSNARNSKQDDLPPPVHCMGQKSFLRREHEMLIETGELPSRLDLLVDTHKRKSDGVIIDPRTILIVDEVNLKAAEKLSQLAEDGDEFEDTPRELTKSEMDDLFRKTAPFKKGRWYGMGSASECIAGSSSSTPSPVITTLQSQLQSTQEELNATRDIVTQQKLDFQAQMVAMKEEYDKRFKVVEERFLSTN